MKELEHRERDKFVPTDVTISVVCKPKHIYPSTATNWANDLFATRYAFRMEHEIPIKEKLSADQYSMALVPDEVKTYLIGIRDSVFQFQLMTVEADYERVKEGGDHLSREQLRLAVLSKRLDLCCAAIASYDMYPVISECMVHLVLLKDRLKTVQETLLANKGQNYCNINNDYEAICQICRTFRYHLEESGLPKHRPLDIQTSDAGPGVASHEQMTQIRMAECFMINCLDLQSRFHYAPNDSASHVVEKVMRSLNECLGDGRSVPVPFSPLCDTFGRIPITELSTKQLKKLQAEKERATSMECAQIIKNRFNGKSCMGTSIHASLPCYDNHLQFFFDDEFMCKCANASSEIVLEKCAGKAYYKFVRNFFEEHYFLYDNGFEGIRNGCQTESGKECHFHSNYENPSLLSNGCSGGIPVTRVNPPVPDYSLNAEEFHYALPEHVLSGEITEKFGLNKETVKDPVRRQRNDFCPREQLNRMMESCGQPDLESTEIVTPQESVSTYTVVDKNDTLGKMLSKVDDVVQMYTGEDLRQSVVTEIKRRYNSRVKAFVTKRTNASTRAAEKARTYNDFEWENLISKNELSGLYVSQLDLYLIENLKLTRSQLDKKGFTKEKKIEAIKKHYYSNVSDQVSGVTNAVVVTLPASLKPGGVSTKLRVPPWGGELSLPYVGRVKLVNTCPIDNFLTIFYVLLKYHRKVFLEFSSSVEVYANTLVTIYELFEKGNFAEGKLEWLKLFPGRFQVSPRIDLWGNEQDLFVSRLYSTLETTFTSKCASPACPASMKQYRSSAIVLSEVQLPLQASLTSWFNTDEQHSKCGNAMHHIPPVAEFFIAKCRMEDPVTHQLIDTPGAYCGGLRTNSRRQFVRGNPPFLLLSLDLFVTEGGLSDVMQLPNTVEVSGERYCLFGLTYYNGGHYRGAVLLQALWHYYDGTWERECQGRGLKNCNGHPFTPAGYMISHSVFVKQDLLC